MLYHFDGSFLRLITRALELSRPRRALGINAIDEVPDSTWFTNRIGVRDLTLDELRRGPATVESPELHKPWTIKSTKVGGASIGFLIVDARGEKHLLKFDPLGLPEGETAADAITSRLLWACGFNVPEDHVVYFRPDELELARDAVVKDTFGNKHPLVRAEVDRMLAQVEIDADGRIRALTSRILDGEWLGGHPSEGVRDDDPNDRIPHELRRDLRGAYAMFAWLDHMDVKESNFLDMWIAEPEHELHYVKHYLIDFGKSLGFMARFHHDPRDSHVYSVDFPDMLAALVTGGLRERAWERRTAPQLRGIGLYEVGTYDPGSWKPYTPAYVPLLTADPYDNFWGAKILMRFTRAQLRAVVETARLTDPRSVDYLVDTLVARQRATAHYWFQRVDPLDRFRIVPEGTKHVLCFDDLALSYGLATPVATRYAATMYDRAGRVIGDRVELRPGAARTCTAPLVLGAGDDGYTIVRIDTTRPGLAGTGTVIHLARDPISRVLRVIGLWRP